MEMDVKYDHVIQEIGDMIIKKKKKREPHKLVIVNEEELIRQVEIRPMLYDKSLKGYRKSALRDQCWKEIAAAVNSTVEECRKRWRSLRDAFAKHYKQFDVTMNLKRKKWIFYDQMYFIAPYLDCSNAVQESAHITQLQDNSHESILINGEDHLEGVSVGVEESSDFKHSHHLNNANKATSTTTEETTTVVEHVNIVDSKAHIRHHHQQQPQHHHYQQHEQNTQTTAHISTIDLNDENQFVARIFTTATAAPTEYDTTTIATTTSSNNVGVSVGAGGTIQHVNNDNTRKTTVEGITVERCDEYASIVTTDPDERFLLSCAPILKRLSDKKNALARLRIQQILFSIEFGEQ